jgi:hypothetical protein
VWIDGCRLFGGMIDGIGVRNAFVKDPSIQLGGSSVLLFVSIFSGKRGYGKGWGRERTLLFAAAADGVDYSVHEG